MDPVTDVLKDVASEVATTLLAKIKKHVEYVYKYKDNLNALQVARDQLVAKRTDASHYSDDTNRRMKDVGATVALWQSSVDELLQKANDTISRNNISCLNLLSRYSIGKHAWELTQKINGKVASAPDFGTSFDHPIAEGATFNLRGFTDFHSRREILNGVLEALKDEDVSMCSICGMGGIGKTTLAKKLVQRLEDDGLFGKVAMVTVSQEPNFERIQKEIIELLGLKLEDNTMPGRAKNLNNWLSSHKTLLILDDVWLQLNDEDFEKIGIPLRTKGCKIVVTSRNEDECKKMGSQKNFPLKVLNGEEARDLFIQNVGRCDEILKATIMEIVRECDGLPIAIVTIARALNDKPAGVWNDSLRKLQMSNLQAISGMDKVYSRIQLSYDLLNDQEAQSCFRLCCLFPEDYNVPIEKLVFYGKGLELFEGVTSLKEARDRVDSIIDKLKKSFLLLDGVSDGYVKLHDIVRDFAISNSSKDEHPYLVRCEKEMKKWPETYQLENCRAISIECKTIENGIPVDLRCPNLQLLRLHFEEASGALPIRFFEGMEELRVVDLKFQSPLPLLTMQKNLRTLLINNEPRYSKMKGVEPSYFRDMLGHGNMKNLEIISLSSMSFSCFPEEIGQLHNLRCLRFYDSVSFEYMPPGVLSKLVKLEELGLPLAFANWGLEQEGGNRVNASLKEIESLGLKSISIYVPRDLVLEEKLVSNITRFQILWGDRDFRLYSLNSNILVVDGVNACDVTTNGTSCLLKKCDYLKLKGVRKLKYIMVPCTYFPSLKGLKICYMDSLEEIWHGPYLSNIQSPCFPKLTSIEICFCPKLKRVFPISVARELKQLQSMAIYGCEEMEEIFSKCQADDGNQIVEESIEKVDEREGDPVIVFPRLNVLRLQRMPVLRTMYNGNLALECPSLQELEITGCNNMEAISYGSFNAPATKEIELRGVRSLKNITTWLHLQNGIPQLTNLNISKCHEMKYLGDAIADQILPKAFFSPLKELSIRGMDCLEEIWHGPYFSPCFPNLTRIEIYKCPKLKRVFPLSVLTQLRQLQSMEIMNCQEMEEIFYEDQVDDENEVESSVQDEKSEVICPTLNSILCCRKQPSTQQIVEERFEEVNEEVNQVIALPLLKILYLGTMPKLRVVSNGNHALEFPSLEEVRIEQCNNMEALSYGSFNAPTTELTISKFYEMKYLVDGIADPNLLKVFFSRLSIYLMHNLEEIWHGPYLSNIQPPCFPILTQIHIFDCPKLKRVFPLSVATQLVQLQSIGVRSCEEMEEIVHDDQTMEETSAKLDGKEADDGNHAMDAFIIFPQLRELQLLNLSILRIIYDGNHAIELPSLETFQIVGCYKIEALSKGTFKAPKLKAIEIDGHPYYSGEDFNTIAREMIKKIRAREEDKHGQIIPPHCKLS